MFEIQPIERTLFLLTLFGLSYFFLFSYFPFLVWLNNFFLKFCFIFLIKIFEKTLTLRKAAFLNCTFLDFRLLYSTCTIVSRSKNIKLLIRNVHAFLFLSRLKKIGLHRSEFGGFITLQTLQQWINLRFRKYQVWFLKRQMQQVTVARFEKFKVQNFHI